MAATNVDLRTLVREGKFREDLYYRISKAVVHIPPLRERPEDIPVLAAHFLDKINQSFRTSVSPASGGIIDMLMAYPWPGNVRELINVLEQAVLRASNEGSMLEKHLPPELISKVQESGSKTQGRETSWADEDIRKGSAFSPRSRLAGEIGGKLPFCWRCRGRPFYSRIRRYGLGVKYKRGLTASKPSVIDGPTG